MELKGKVAVVTGASSGLGKAVVDLLAQKGVSVFALARSVDAIEYPDLVVKVACDIADEASVKQAFVEIDKKAKNLDVLVNCAGVGLVKELEKSSVEEIDRVLDVNLRGNILVAQEVYKRMLANKSGFIVNVGSTTSLKPRDMEPIYAASKWGIRGFTQSLMLAGRDHGIKVSGVYPGGMKSNFWKDHPDKDISDYIEPKVVAGEIIKVLESDGSVSVSEVVIERG